MSTSSRITRLTVGVALAAVFLWLAARGVSWAAVGTVLASAQYRFVALALLAVTASTALRTVCWRPLLGTPPVSISFSRAWSVLLVGQLLNIAVPARVGDLARVYLIGRAGQMSRAAAATGLVVEKLFDLTSVLLLLGAISWWLPLPSALTQTVRGLVILAVSLAAAIFVAAWRAEHLTRWLAERVEIGGAGWRSRLVGALANGLRSLEILRDWRQIALLQTGYLMVWGTLVLSTHLVLQAVNLELPVVVALVVLAVVQVGTAVPSTPGKVGVFQYLTVIALTPFGVESDLALSAALLLHLVSYLPPVVLGGLGLHTALPALRGTGILTRSADADPQPVSDVGR